MALERRSLTEYPDEGGQMNAQRKAVASVIIAMGLALTTPNLARAAIVDAVEYYHAGFNHYFVTASATEISVLDGGAFGGVWTRTGQSFKVDTVATSTSIASVCRYFTTAYAPRSSHFYSGIANECAVLRTNPVWQYEGIAFYVALPTTAGVCQSGYSKVYRLYNGARSGAPNHRYTTSTTIRTQMLNQGWVPEGYGEGVAFCSPNASTDAYALTARVLGGTWYMSYTFGSAYTDRITFTSVVRNTSSSSTTMPYLLLGVGPYGNQVMGGYAPASDLYVAMWQFNTTIGGWNGYGFQLTGTNSLTGCYDYDPHVGDLFAGSTCYTLTGYRSPPQTSAALAEPVESDWDQSTSKRLFWESVR